MKAVAADLAICGGQPAFDSQVVVGRPNVGDPQALWSRLSAALERRWLSNGGPLVAELENRICAELGVRHCVAVCNGTVGLEVALRAAGATGQVIVPGFSFVATAHAPRWLGLEPVFADIDPDTHNIDPKSVDALITPRTSAVIGVHIWGRPCDVQGLESVCRRHGVALVFDAAHAFACSHQGRSIGCFGDVSVFSFHATKFFNSFEGGAIVTDDKALAERARAMINFGMPPGEGIQMLGTNGKMCEAAGAMGLTSLDAMEGFVTKNHRNYVTYSDELTGVAGLELVMYDEHEKCNFQYIIVEVDEPQAGLSADDLLRVLAAEHVSGKRYFSPALHQLAPYAEPERGPVPHLAHAERLARRTLALPTGSGVSEDDVRRVCMVLRAALANAAAVREALDGLMSVEGR